MITSRIGDLAGLAGLADSYGDDTPIEGTSLPSSAMLQASWNPAPPPTPISPPRSSKILAASARPPASPSDLAYGPFPPPTTGGAAGPEKIFGIIPLPSFMPKWAAYTISLVVLAFGADYAYRRFARGGRRVVSNPKGRRRGGRVAHVFGEGDDELMEKAAKFREEFHWGIKGRKKPRRAKVSDTPRVLTKLGELTAVTYKTKKRGEKAQFFYHEFGEEGGKPPVLGMDIENKKLHIVGGTYDVQADGIID